MKCAFCHKTVQAPTNTKDKYFTCDKCGTTQETILLDRPYYYTVGNGTYLEAPHVEARFIG